MKKLKMDLLSGALLCAVLLALSPAARSQTLESEVPGDHFSLEGALELFKKSSSPEEFEKMLNSPDSKVNNLDLNGDGDIDYIRVIDRNQGNVHAFVIQAVISDSESQDVAVIELEKLADGKAILQITGDADVYGMETIIEPTEEVRVNAGTTTATNVVNVWTWPSVQYVYGPTYSAWASPWRWSYYPYWWRPWRPVAYYVYDPWWRPYRPYYAVCYRHRIGYLPVIYRPYRRTSVVVYTHNHNQIESYRSRYNHPGSGSRSDRYSSDRYSSNSRSGRTSGRSDRYGEDRTRNAQNSNFVRAHSNRSSAFDRGFNRPHDMNNPNSENRHRSGPAMEPSRNVNINRERTQQTEHDQNRQRTFDHQRNSISPRHESSSERSISRQPSRTEAHSSNQRSSMTNGGGHRSTSSHSVGSSGGHHSGSRSHRGN